MEDVIDHQAGHGALRPSHAVVSRVVTAEAESYNSSVAGIDIEAVRAGVGVGPTRVLAAIGDRFTFTFTESKVGFPMLSRTTVPDDMILMAYIRSATPGSRWRDARPRDDALWRELRRASGPDRAPGAALFQFALPAALNATVTRLGAGHSGHSRSSDC